MKHIQENIQKLTTPEVKVHLDYVMSFVQRQQPIPSTVLRETYAMAQYLEAELQKRTLNLLKND